MLYHHLQAPSSENTNFWNRSRWFLGRLIFSDVHVLSESPWLPLWVVNVAKHPVQVTCSSSVFFWNGYSVLRFFTKHAFLLFFELVPVRSIHENITKHYQKKVAAFPYNKRWNHCNESVQTTCCILSSRTGPSLFPTHISQIPDFPIFHLPRWLVNEQLCASHKQRPGPQSLTGISSCWLKLEA